MKRRDFLGGLAALLGGGAAVAKASAEPSREMQVTHYSDVRFFTNRLEADLPSQELTLYDDDGTTPIQSWPMDANDELVAVGDVPFQSVGAIRVSGDVVEVEGLDQDGNPVIEELDLSGCVRIEPVTPVSRPWKGPPPNISVINMRGVKKLELKSGIG
jgi:hypothetical protein